MAFISVVPGLSLPSASIVDAIYPIGVIYESDDSTPPNVVFGRGTWERILGVMLVGVNESDPDFSAAGKTGGEKAHVLTQQEMPVHNHSANVTSSHTHTAGTLQAASAGSHNHMAPLTGGASVNVSSGGVMVYTFYSSGASASTSEAGAHTHSIGGATGSSSGGGSVSIANAGEGRAHNNMPPFRTTYMWRRTG